MTLSELSPKQKTVLKWAFTPSTREQYKAIICDGAVRSGKTVCMLTGFILWAMRYFSGQNFGICGKTVASAERNIIRPAQEQADLAACFTLSYRRSDHVLMVRGLGRENRFYIFGGKDESSY
ncbi:MAG: PBSX family phage terminase large subunit, partial [Clostridiales bacterium]|nr:PBSX family phage terminase large subunit [Clostridiales bacterium]